MNTIAEVFLGGTVRTKVRKVRLGRGLLISDDMSTVALLFPGDSLVSLAAMDKVLEALHQLRKQLEADLNARAERDSDLQAQLRDYRRPRGNKQNAAEYP